MAAKQALIESGVGALIGEMSESLAPFPLILGFLAAGLVQIATELATVALTMARESCLQLL